MNDNLQIELLGKLAAEKEIQTLDSLGYKIYQYKKDKQGNYYVDSTYNKFLDTNNSN